MCITQSVQNELEGMRRPQASLPSGSAFIASLWLLFDPAGCQHCIFNVVHNCVYNLLVVVCHSVLRQGKRDLALFLSGCAECATGCSCVGSCGDGMLILQDQQLLAPACQLKDGNPPL